MSSWGCPHELDGLCQHVNQRPCDPGMKGCVLAGRVTFSNPAKNRPAPDSLRSPGRQSGVAKHPIPPDASPR